MTEFIKFLIIALTAILRPCWAKLATSSPMPDRVSVSSPKGLPQLVIPVFTHYGGFIIPMGPVCTEGIRIALDALHAANVLTRYELAVRMNDDMCDIGSTVSKVTKMLNNAGETLENQMPLVIGPSCAANEFTGVQMKHYHHVGLADIAPVFAIADNRRKYDSFNQIQPSYTIFFEAIPAFIKSNGWSKVFLLSETYNYWIPFEEILNRNLFRNNISLTGTAKVSFIPGSLPTEEQFDVAVRELAALEPRIVIVHTAFGAMIACHLYRYKLYGPGYVYIYFGIVYFLPNTQLRDPGCTDEMIAAVLQSVIFFSYGSPINLDAKTAVDALGVTGTQFEDTLKQRIDRPELDNKWFIWRTHCYSAVVAAALALNDTETLLEKTGDTLINWRTNSANFAENGSYIHGILKKSVSQLKFNGLNSYARHGMNSQKGITGFFQMQFDRTGASTGDLSAAFRTVPVASFDSSLPNGVVVHGPGRYIWRTHDGKQPLDSLRIIKQKEPIVSHASKSVTITLAAILLIINFGLSAFILAKRKTVSKSLPLFNATILIGNMIMLSYILIMPMEGSLTSHLNCILASFVLIAGFTTVNTVIFAKMYIASRMKVIGVGGSAPSGTNIFRSKMSNIKSSVGIGLSLDVIERNRTALLEAAEQENSKTLPSIAKRTFLCMLVWIFFQLAITSIWLGVEPFKTIEYMKDLERQSYDISIAYQSYSQTCSMDFESKFTKSFIGILLSLYGILVFRSFHLAFKLRNITIPGGFINDLSLIRVTAYMIGLLVIAGGAVIWAFFTSEPGILQTAVSGLVIVITSVTTGVIFVPKLNNMGAHN